MSIISDVLSIKKVHAFTSSFIPCLTEKGLFGTHPQKVKQGFQTFNDAAYV